MTPHTLTLDGSPTPSFRIDIDPARDSMAVSGELDCASSPLVDRAVELVIGGACPQVLVDLSAVTFMDGAGIGALVRARHAMSLAGIEMRVRGATRRVCQLLALCNVELQAA